MFARAGALRPCGIMDMFLDLDEKKGDVAAFVDAVGGVAAATAIAAAAVAHSPFQIDCVPERLATPEMWAEATLHTTEVNVPVNRLTAGLLALKGTMFSRSRKNWGCDCYSSAIEYINS
jgi:hypothetical protein